MKVIHPCVPSHRKLYVQYLEEGLRANLGRLELYGDLERLRTILRKGNCAEEGWSI